MSIKYNDNESEIINFSKELAKVLILNNEFIEAENILLNIEDDEVSSDLYKIYTNEEFSKNSCLNKKQFSNKLIDLLGRLDRQSIEYQDIKIKLEELNIFDNQMIEFHEKFVSLERKYESTVAKLTQDIQLLSTHVSDKTLLRQINCNVESTDKKIDKVSITLSNKIDTSKSEITNKLDEIKLTNNQQLNNFVENIYKSNQNFVSETQTIYKANDRVNKEAKIALDNSIKSMSEKIENFLSKLVESIDTNENSIDEIEKLIKNSNESFCKEIKELYEKEEDLHKDELLQLSIDSLKKEHQRYIDNLLKEKNREITSLEESISELSINSENSQKRIEDLNKGIKQLKGKTEQIEELKESINLSSETSKRLEKLEEESKGKLEKYFEQIEEKYKELDEEKKKFFKEELSEILKSINSSIDTLSYAPLDKEDFERISKELEDLDSKLDKVSEKVDDLLIFVQTIKNNNNSLIAQIQKLYPKDYLTEQQLNLSLDKNREDIQKVLHLPIEEIKQAVENCNNSLYGKIQTLYKDFPKKKSVDIDIELIKKDNEKAILLLEKKYQNEIITIKAKNSKDSYIKWAVVGITLGIVSFIGYMSLEKFENKTKINELNNTKIEKQIENLDFKITEIGKESNTSKSLLKTIQKKLLTKKDDIVVATTQTPIKTKEKREVYIIKKGDSLSSISKRFYGDSNIFKKIINENDGLDPKKLQIGQKINIPN